MKTPASIFLTIGIFLAGASHLYAQDVEYRLSVVDEGTLSKLNLETPLNYHNRLLPQSTNGNEASGNLFLSYRGLSTSLNLSTLAHNLSAPDYNYSIREFSYDLSVTENFDITVGKKILKWGTGYAFNPTGVVEPQRSPSDPSDRLNQNEGRKLIAVNVFSGKSSLTLVYVNDVQLESWKFRWGEEDFALRAYTFLNGLDLSGVLHYTKGDRLEAGTNWSYVLGDNLELHGELLAKRGSSSLYHKIIMLDNSEQIFTSDPYVPFFEHSGQIFYKLVVGGQYTFENGVNVAVEYYRNTEGLSKSEWIQWMKFVKFQNGIQQGTIAVPPELIEPSRYNLLWALRTLSPRGTMRDYLFGREYYSIDGWSFEFLQLMNAGDASVVLVPTVTYRISKFFSLYGRFTSFLGENESEYGALFTKYSTNLGIQFQL